MPLYNFYCEKCEKRVRKLIASPATVVATQSYNCADCSTLLKREAPEPTAQAVETLDNGLMVKKVTRPADAERIYKEYAKSDPKLNRD